MESFRGNGTYAHLPISHRYRSVPDHEVKVCKSSSLGEHGHTNRTYTLLYVMFMVNTHLASAHLSLPVCPAGTRSRGHVMHDITDESSVLTYASHSPCTWRNSYSNVQGHLCKWSLTLLVGRQQRERERERESGSAPEATPAHFHFVHVILVRF